LEKASGLSPEVESSKRLTVGGCALRSFRMAHGPEVFLGQGAGSHDQSVKTSIINPRFTRNSAEPQSRSFAAHDRINQIVIEHLDPAAWTAHAF